MTIAELNTLWHNASVFYARGGSNELLWDYERISHRLGINALLDTIGFIDVVYVIQADRFIQVYGRDWGDKFDSQIAELQLIESAKDDHIDFILGV
jgi:hypothetical protein